jgi:hypothetical protein
MTREAIRLNPDKVKLHIAHAGIPIKQLLDGRTKTVHRIKAGKNTTMATAHKLATDLGVTVDDLIAPVNDEDIGCFLPKQWLYDEAPPSNNFNDKKPVPYLGDAGVCGYQVDRSPTAFNGPIEQLLKWHEVRNSRKIVLRRENQAYIFEIHYFDYLSDRELVYMFTTGFRFFPLARNGDTFNKAPLSDYLDRHVWGTLRQTALENAELVSIEGHDYPAHPDAYFPVVRFYQDSMCNQRVYLGARMFEQLQVDFKRSLADYLNNVDAARVSAQATFSGIELRVKPVKPEVWTLGWREEVIEMRVDLVWRTATGELARAPWRRAHREKFIEAINSHEVHVGYSRGMPIPYVPKNGWDEPDKPFEPDTTLSEGIIAAIDGIARPGSSRF